MKLDKKLLWLGLDGCLFCGSLVPSSDGLCLHCSAELWRWSGRKEIFFQQRHKLAVYSLFTWYPNRQAVLSTLLTALKGEKCKDLWRTYAEEFWRRYLASNPPSENRKPWLIVPCPSRSKKEDHAALFAKGLAEASGAAVYFCLATRDKGRSQKTKSRIERLRAEFDWSENFSRNQFRALCSGKRVIFVDDVFTTGGTALAAWKALGKPKDFTIWTLAQRASLAGRPRI